MPSGIGWVPSLGVMALGKLVDTAEVVVADPVTVLVVGATMIVVGNHEADESVMVVVARRLVPKVGVDVVEAVVEVVALAAVVLASVEDTVVSADVELGKSVSVMFGGSVTVVGKVSDDAPVGDGVSVAVEFSDTVGSVMVPLAVVMEEGRSVAVLFSDTVGMARDEVGAVSVGRSVSVLFGKIVTSVGDALLEPVNEVMPLLAAEGVGNSAPDEVSVFEAEPVGVRIADEPVPTPVKPPEMVGDSVTEASVAEVSVAAEVPVADEPRATLVRLETPELTPPTAELTPLTAELTPPTMELRRSVLVLGEGVADAESPVAGPVKPEVIETSLVGEAVLSVGVTETAVVAPVMPESEIASLVGEGVTSEDVTPVVGPVRPDPDEMPLGVAEASEEVVTPVPAPVALASMVEDESVAVDGRIVFTTPETTLLTPLGTVETALLASLLTATMLLTSLVTAETMLLTPLGTAETTLVISLIRPETSPVAEEAVLDKIGVVVTPVPETVGEASLSEDAVEETMIPLEVSETTLLDGLGETVKEDETIPVGPITIGVWVEESAEAAVSLDEVVA